MKKNNRNERKMTGGGFRRGALAVFAAAALTWCCPFVSLADASGTVKVESAIIRGSADTNSTPVGSVVKGKTVSIKSETTDASGTRWYEVYLSADSTGYVRADLIEREGSDPLPTSSGTMEASGQTESSQGDEQASSSGASAQAETAMEAQYAKVSVQVAKIRKEPSTNVGEVESLQNGAELIVSGQSNGSDGKVWYFVTFTGADGSSKTG
ncbi:MAG: SH3 domain-containing protein, partial [Lachnospiraceae bacterium]|nr:SH3 domain-containing protein [Lachnospiraceae bacterium]